jgi:hypothetical protein
VESEFNPTQARPFIRALREAQMDRSLPRRSFLLLGSVLVTARPGFATTTATSQEQGARSDRLHATFPTQDPDVVREVVTVAHGNMKRLQELVDRRPTLALATWDWGFGDWETALGAASHIGNRQIAEYLIGNGARPTIFSAAMLGQLDVVAAFVMASPGVQRIHGPHGITLMAHAKAGGERAKPVVAFLEKLGDADPCLDSPSLTDAEVESLAGTYAYGADSTERIIVDGAKGQLGFMRMNATRRGLAQRGPGEFSPAGAPGVRIKFVVERGRAVRLTVHDPDLVLTAQRV